MHLCLHRCGVGLTDLEDFCSPAACHASLDNTYTNAPMPSFFTLVQPVLKDMPLRPYMLCGQQLVQCTDASWSTVGFTGVKGFIHLYQQCMDHCPDMMFFLSVGLSGVLNSAELI